MSEPATPDDAEELPALPWTQEAQFAASLRDRMTALSLTPGDLARRVGWPGAAIERLLARRVRPRYEMIRALADALSVEPQELWADLEVAQLIDVGDDFDGEGYVMTEAEAASFAQRPTISPHRPAPQSLPIRRRNASAPPDQHAAPDQLTAVVFTAPDQTLLEHFYSGDEPWSRDVVEGIRGASARVGLDHGMRGWLFETTAGEIVGFGAISASRRRAPDGSTTNLILLPLVAIDQRFHGLPSDPERRYARQVMQHLIAQASALATEAAADSASRAQWLLLLVHIKNSRAIRFYERCGFEVIPDDIRGPNRDHLVMKLALFPE